MSLTCRHALHLSCDWFEGRLDGFLSNEVRRHLADCSTCRDAFLAVARSLEEDFQCSVEIPAPAGRRRLEVA